MPTSNGQAGALGLIKGLFVLGLIVWGGLAWWQLRTARRAGEVLQETVARQWPEDGPPQPGTRQRLVAAAERFGQGDFRAVVKSLGPVGAPSAEQQNAARRFFAENTNLGDRLAAVATEAGTLEDTSDDVGPVRDELARALLAAARDDAAAVAAHLDVAESALQETTFGVAGSTAGSAAEAVAGQLRRIEPVVLLGRDLMLEGHTAIEQLLRRAAGHARDGQYREALSLIRLAAGLSGVDVTAAEATGEGLPDWFTELPPPELPTAAPEEARAAVELCQAAAMSLDASEAVEKLVDRARRDLTAGRPSDAAWFAGVALAALGIAQNPIAAEKEP